MMEPPVSKRPRIVNEEMIAYTPSAASSTAPRTSSLPSPTLKLTGHKGSVYALAYSPNGDSLASASFDMTCLLWDARSYQNYNVLAGHKNAILDVKWSGSGDRVATASADKTIGWWDANTGERIKKLQGHDGIVNAIDTGSSSHLSASASDDATVKMWDVRLASRNAVAATLPHDYAVTAVAYNGSGSANDNSNTVYSGGLDNAIYAWDVRMLKKQMKLMGHKDTITSLSLSSTHAQQLLSQSMDGTLKTWDIQPFVVNSKNRLLKSFSGFTHGAEKGALLKCAWSSCSSSSSDGSSSSSSSSSSNMVTGGSSDGMVHIWDEVTTEELYLLPGHTGCVNTVVFHPRENVVASGSSDKCIFVGELGQ